MSSPEILNLTKSIFLSQQKTAKLWPRTRKGHELLNKIPSIANLEAVLLPVDVRPAHQGGFKFSLTDDLKKCICKKGGVQTFAAGEAPQLC
ncbi:hypothetical protein LCGC14_0623890 [marine sediment metagenome]|uniref:Uncharacterized protein n=1 Tax=marine sediment metagenome TaxID=412755 RepID=A0A0F9UCK6_9ZZZZ